MTDPRLPARVEVSALLRLAEQGGGHGAVLARGDDDRGGILVEMRDREGTGLWERLWRGDGYRWSLLEQADDKQQDYLQKRRRDDPDLWVVELFVPSAKRFTAEMMS